jgi:hypothetical protein
MALQFMRHQDHALLEPTSRRHSRGITTANLDVHDPKAGQEKAKQKGADLADGQQQPNS